MHDTPRLRLNDQEYLEARGINVDLRIDRALAADRLLGGAS